MSLAEPYWKKVLTPSDIEHRREFESFVTENSEPWYRDNLGRLYAKWHEWNVTYFEGLMLVPYILLTDMHGARTMGDCASISGFGGKSQIRLRDSLLQGNFGPMSKGTKDAEGCMRVVEDTLLHEMIHQYQQEILNDAEPAWHGHGPIFRDKCNEIGATLGFLKVRTCKKRGPDKDLPSCAYWPHRPDADEYYLGAFPSRMEIGTPKSKPLEVITETEVGTEPSNMELVEVELTSGEVVEVKEVINNSLKDKTKELFEEAREKLSEENYLTLKSLVKL